MRVVGYADRFSVEAGAPIGFMISSQAARYRASVVRLIHGDDNPAGPGFKSAPVASAIEGEYDGHPHELYPGSFIRVDGQPGLDPGRSFSIQMWIRPTLVEPAHQTLLGWAGAAGEAFALVLDGGYPTLRVRSGGESGVLRLERATQLHTWYFIAATYDASSREGVIVLSPLEPTAAQLAGSVHGTLSPEAAAGAGPEAGTASAAGSGSSALLIAARPVPGSTSGATDYYNGKIDSPRLYGRAISEREINQLRGGADPGAVTGLLGAWDFSVGIDTSAIADRSGAGLDAVAVQRPGRAVTGHNWDGSESNWTHAPEQYGAIHFHDDDLDDAGWPLAFEWTVPPDLASGVYALHLETVDGEPAEDDIPFVVRPRRDDPTARILFLMPTFSYLAYGNEHLLGTPQMRQMMIDMGVDPAAVSYPSQPQDKYVVANHLNSLYDHHTDDSGVFYSSRMRPVVNMRPKYKMEALDDGHGSPHQFNADLHLVDWLHEQGYTFDVATDEDLYRDGQDLLSGYDVVLTGTHHEYWAASMLDAMRDYLLAGGRLMYLAGNGFYWVTELEPERGHTIEIRRRGPSTRSWDADPGEGNLSFTGELGGLWRYRNRPPQRMVGVGFTAQGTGAGRPYERQPDSFDPRAAFVFEGIGANELIGDHPCLVSSYGAAGFEIDRVDHSLGSPHRTLLLATASGFSDSFQHVSEEITVSTSLQGGTVNPLVRADMVLLEYPHGGAVFSPASITWCGSLSYDNYDNNVSRITRNVLDRFTAKEPVFAPPAT
jgi:N,N-dimethylformamidase